MCSSADLGFFILRSVQRAGNEKLCERCFHSVRAVHPEVPIIVIDDNSQPSLAVDDAFVQLDGNARVVGSNAHHRGSGELYPYYLFQTQRPFKRAIILHDSMLVRRPITPSCAPVQFLWHFDAGAYLEYVKDTVLPLLTYLRHHVALHKMFYTPSTWKGCFGVTSVISLAAVDMLQSRYDLWSLLPRIRTRKQRQAVERVFAMACYDAGLIPDAQRPSLCGDIFSHPRRWQNYDPYDHDPLLEAYDSPVLKTWHRR